VEIRLGAADSTAAVEQILHKLEQKDHGRPISELEGKVYQLESSNKSLSNMVQKQYMHFLEIYEFST